MNNTVKLLICCSLLLLPSTNVFSQVSVNSVLFSSAVSFQKNIVSFSEQIALYEKKIVKCENTISNSERILKLSKEGNNKEAERISSEAIVTSKRTITDCQKFILLLNSKKRQNESALASVKKAMESGSTHTNKTNAVASKHKGNVSIIKQNGEQYALNSAENPCIDEGDVISTSSDGFADLNFLDGRGALTVGPDSKIKMYREKDSTNVLEVMKGKIYSQVLKPDEYEKKLLDIKKCLNEDSLHMILSSYDRHLYIEHFLEMNPPLKRKLEVRTPAAVTSVRGTIFTVSMINENTTELKVIEGKVEMTPANGTSAIMVNGGQSCLMDKNKKDPQLIQSDSLNINKWWKYEE